MAERFELSHEVSSSIRVAHDVEGLDRLDAELAAFNPVMPVAIE